MEEVDRFDSRFEGSWGNVGVLDALDGMREEDGGVDEDELKYGNDWAIMLENMLSNVNRVSVDAPRVLPRCA